MRRRELYVGKFFSEVSNFLRKEECQKRAADYQFVCFLPAKIVGINEKIEALHVRVPKGTPTKTSFMDLQSLLNWSDNINYCHQNEDAEWRPVTYDGPSTPGAY